MFHTFVFCCLCCFRLFGVFGDELKSVMEGESVTLQINVNELQEDDEILWTFGTNGPLIAKTNGVTNTIFDALDGRFRGRLKLEPTGSLTITNTRTTDSGLYEVTISTSRLEAKHRFNVTVNELDELSSPPPVSLIVLICASAAGSLLIVAAVIGIFCVCRKHRKTDREDQARNEEITYADPTFYKQNAQKSNVKEENDVVYACVAIRR